MIEYKKILNPFIHNKGDQYNCFGCSPQNSIGLNLSFYSDGEKLYCDWLPDRNFEGYHNVIHGGLQATIMDEIASWFVYAMLDTAGVTQKLNVEYLKPLYTSKGVVKIVASLMQRSYNTASVKTELINSDGVVCSSADVEYFLFPPAIARKKYMYPGKEAFWEK